MHPISVFGTPLMSVGWTAITNQSLAIRVEFPDRRNVQVTPVAGYIPLH
jgi:hypothetical protein